MKTIKSIYWGIVLSVSLNMSAQTLQKTYYDYKKTKVKEEYYLNSAGQMNGLYKQYLESGLVEVQGNYKNDKKVGTWVFTLDAQGHKNINTYDNDGNANGFFVEHCFGHPNSKLSEGSYKTGQKDGIWKEYFCPSETVTKSDQIQKLSNYSLGKLNGTYTEYFENGKIKMTGNYKLNEKDAEWKGYNENGVLIISTTYGKKFGDFDLVDEIKYFTSGDTRKIRRTSVYGWLGKISNIGEELYYDSTGVLFGKNVWNKDNVTDTKDKRMYEGSHEDYFPNGKIQSQSSVRYDPQNDNTYFVGLITIFYENGKKQHVYQKDNNGQYIQGTEKFYNENEEEVKK
jgi:antitoxin component YwqK of YwqJK toxin-antitoxin module